MNEVAWKVGKCSNCLDALDPDGVSGTAAAFCSPHCRKQAEGVRYLRAIIRDGRSADPMTAMVAYNNIVVFLALDLAYTRPRLGSGLRSDVLSRNDGLCVQCHLAPATEVDHISGPSEDPANLRGLCRECHENKPRGNIPDDLTRDGTGNVDYDEASRDSSKAGATPWHPLRRCPVSIPPGPSFVRPRHFLAQVASAG